MNFGDLPKEYCQKDNAKIAIIPVPYDGTSTWIKGADLGPKRLIEASANMELYDIESDYEVYKQGIFTDQAVEENSCPEKMIDAVETRVTEHIEQKRFTVVLGGEHSVSIGAITAHVKKFSDLCVLQLDAHSDLRQEYQNSRYSHACVMARVKEMCPIVQVGIRSMDIVEKKELDMSRVFFAEKIWGKKNWIPKVIEKLTKNVYLTIDLDVFDPSVLPSTGTPEPGGLFWYDVLSLARKVVEKKNLVGLDVVELCPGENRSSDFLAAKLIYKILTYKFCEGKNEKEASKTRSKTH